jgi:very-short-patch-repair endonuclease
LANARARELRNNLTDAERKLWWRLRALKSHDCHFRRQAPIDRFIVDFVCFSKRLIIEVDGGQHGFDQGQKADQVRDNYLRREGFDILRFWNNDVLSNTDGVMQVIIEKVMAASPPPRSLRSRPSPQGGG